MLWFAYGIMKGYTKETHSQWTLLNNLDSPINRFISDCGSHLWVLLLLEEAIFNHMGLSVNNPFSYNGVHIMLVILSVANILNEICSFLKIRSLTFIHQDAWKSVRLVTHVTIIAHPCAGFLKIRHI